jgi:hypothetical protein
MSAYLRFISDIEGARIVYFLSTAASLRSFVSNTIRLTHRTAALNYVIKYFLDSQTVFMVRITLRVPSRF